MKRFKFTIRGNEYETEIIKLKGLNALIEVNGTKYEVELQKPKVRTQLSIKKPSVSISNQKGNSGEQKGNIHIVKAPLPGVIMNVFVKEGDKVSKDDKLLVYEAMKMENLIKSDKDGIIKSLKVRTSDTIIQDEVLMEIEL
ncbi:MAG: acetyl-CoA carboxylase biotin carboxyl carrier protein subunit [Bacteroidales bacterium]|nr:acetyl-CoA carboxylase biotin carboxyl carrier protein subunit [Bacteroidales bacterium]